jgi:putative transcriptional regulator
MATSRRNSRILDEIREGAQGLYEIGLISRQRLDLYQALCELDSAAMSPAHIRALRRKTHLSQAVFAAVLNTSVSTVQKWEIGDKKPSGPSLKLLNLIQRKGIEAVL